MTQITVKVNTVSPDEAEKIYYQAYSKALSENPGVVAVVQKELRMKAWQAVVDKINQENDLKYAEQYLSQST